MCGHDEGGVWKMHEDIYNFLGFIRFLYTIKLDNVYHLILFENFFILVSKPQTIGRELNNEPYISRMQQYRNLLMLKIDYVDLSED